MKTQKKIYVLMLIVLLASLLAGCGSKTTTLTGAERDAVLAYSEAQTDNLMAGMNAGDYAMFSKDFDQAMLTAMSQSQFDTLKKDRDAKLGLYISRQVNSVVQNGDFYTVTYDAKFEKDAAVVVRVVFRVAEPHQISGLWFNK
jgi:major membrane immunogen (membrane-anchored lipoprotein)